MTSGSAFIAANGCPVRRAPATQHQPLGLELRARTRPRDHATSDVLGGQPRDDGLRELPRLGGRCGTRIRTWFEANVTSDGFTPGRPPSPSSRIAIARVSAAPKRTTSQPSSREIEATPAASAASRSSATSTRRTTGGGIGPNRSVTSWRNAARSPAVRARASRRYSSSFCASSGT